MVEYGRGVGEVAGRSGGGAGTGGSGDVGATIGNTISNAIDQVAALPPEMLVLIAVVLFGAIVVLRRAF
jgi:hypothetical protein